MKIRVGTRGSELALWQANEIALLLESLGAQTEIIEIKSEGEINQTTPLYEMGVQGIFTKTLDTALLNNSIDLAIHSLKDVPTQLPTGLVIAATPKRGNPADLLVFKNENDFPPKFNQFHLATSSIRRSAQWLNKFPNHSTEPIRGNINTRLEKLINSAHIHAAIFAAAGIERIGLKVPYSMELDWMTPSPGQGILACICRDSDIDLINLCKKINDDDTSIAAIAERSFLRNLLGGCSTPIAALAVKVNNNLYFKGNVLSVDGKQKVELEMEFDSKNFFHAGKIAAQKIKDLGATEILNGFQK